MNIKQITVGIQRVINLGNYENVRYECSCVAEVGPNDEPIDVYQSALQFCKENVGAEVDRLMAAKAKK